ncbi:MAG: SPFH/Band 7/PHB domain protein [Acidobacteria bacterium]|nr:MAG: SPFH/Band 7/PHB domain protein [Acidobacteriota bacterium]REK00858.1 MAG: SPFH/Band 7/PHB domain protein [Acidobacteriota bacterium]
MLTLIVSTFVTFVGLAILVPVAFFFVRAFGLYTTVEECHAKVFVLFGKVIGTLDEPGLHLPITRFGPRALLVPFAGKVYTLDMRIDQRYLRSRAVNSEEGTPMGIGVWYEMRVTNPVAYLFENTDPAGSLEANVTNATVRCLSNMPLSDMLDTRHKMSRAVRGEVSPKSESWGYSLGSVYIRKVHFRDKEMIDQIEQKVINRLRQVTSAIRQAGDNQVDVITSRAEKEAAVEFARAQAMRPKLVGEALAEIAKDREVLAALFETLETDRMVSSNGEIVLLPGDGALLSQLLASQT